MLGIVIAAVLVVGGGLLWAYLVPKERDRFAWAFWAWVALAIVCGAGVVHDVMLRL